MHAPTAHASPILRTLGLWTRRSRYAGRRTRGGEMTEVVTAPEKRDEQELSRINHWIGGRAVPGTSGRSGPVYNPATGAVAAEVDFASVEEIDAAVAAAKAAFPAWRALSLSRRSELLFRIRQLVDAHREDIARHLTREHGKVLSD